MKLKTILGVLVAAALLVPVSVEAASAKRKSSGARTQDITANPLGLVYGLANVTYEKALSNENSWLVSGLFTSRGVVGSNLTIFGASGAYRWWFDETMLTGWYAGPEVLVTSINWSYEVLSTKYSASGLMFGGGGQGGYQWIFNNGFTLNLGGSIGYLAGSVSSNVAGAPALGFGGVYTGGNLGLGIAF